MMAGVYVPQQMQKRDTLGEVLQGLQVAGTAYGIYKDYKGLEMMKEQKDLQAQQTQAEMAAKTAETGAKAKAAGGFLDVPSQAKLKQEGWREGTALDKNAVPFTIQTPEGEKPTFFRPPMNKEEEALAAAPAKKRDAARDEHEKNIKVSMDLRDRYDKDMTTQLTRGRMNAFAGIEANALGDSHTGPSDMSMVFQFMKMMDPGSTVREGEYASAKDTVTIPQKIVNQYNQMLKDGTMLDNQQRLNFYKEAKSLLAAQLKQQEQTDKRYEADTKKYGLHDPTMVIDPSFKEAYSQIQKNKNVNISEKSGSVGFPGESKAMGAPQQPSFDVDAYLQRQP